MSSLHCMKICTVDGCGKKVFCRSVCRTHYGHVIKAEILLHTKIIDRRVKHGHNTGRRSGPRRSLTISSWMAMRYRCLNKNHPRYSNYGGRGIFVCERWKDSFVNFLADMGERPSKNHSIDRIDTNGNYEPSNCRWATRSEQNSNTRVNIYLTFNGKTQCISAWAKETKIHKDTIRFRVVKAGWSTEKALTTHTKLSMKKIRDEIGRYEE